MTPERLKANLTRDIIALENYIFDIEEYAHILGRRYGAYGYDTPYDIYRTRNALRCVQEECEVDPEAHQRNRWRTIEETARAQGIDPGLLP